MSLRDYLLARAEPEPNSGCWLWTGSVSSNGYGTANVKHAGRWIRTSVTRLIFYPIGREQHVLHRCDTKLCVNPAHLYLGTRSENMADWSRAVREGRAAGRPKTDACPRGHLRSVDGAERKRGWECRACARERRRRVAAC